MDRIDLQIEVPAVTAGDLVAPAAIEGSMEVRARVAAARELQSQRFANIEGRLIRTNAECAGQLLEKAATPDDAGSALMKQAAETLQLSARGYHRTAACLQDPGGSRW